MNSGPCEELGAHTRRKGLKGRIPNMEMGEMDLMDEKDLMDHHARPLSLFRPLGPFRPSSGLITPIQ